MITEEQRQRWMDFLKEANEERLKASDASETQSQTGESLSPSKQTHSEDQSNQPTKDTFLSASEQILRLILLEVQLLNRRLYELTPKHLRSRNPTSEPELKDI